MSEYEHLFSYLDTCSKEELNKLLSDDKSLDTLIAGLGPADSSLEQKSSIDTSNKNLASTNLSKEPQLQELRDRLSEAISDFNDAKKEYEERRRTFKTEALAKCDSLSLETVMRMLQDNAMKAEEETDKLAEEFFCQASQAHQEEDVNAFQRKFLDARTQAHLLRIKADKIKELLPNYMN